MALYGFSNRGNERTSLAPLRSVALLTGFFVFALQPPAGPAAPPTGWDQTPNSDIRTPAHRIRPRAVSLLHEYSRAPLPFPAPPSGWDETPNSDIRTPAHRIRPRAVSLLHEYSRAPSPFPAPPSGFDQTPNSDLRTPAHRIRPRSVELLGDIAYQQEFPTPPSGWDATSASDVRPIGLRQPRRSVELGAINWPAQEPPVTVVVEFNLGWQAVFPDVVPGAQRSRELLGDIAWSPQAFGEFQEGWRQEFSRPYRLTPAPRLEGAIAWRPGEPIAEFQEGWRSRFLEPPKAQPRAVDTLGSPIWAARVPIVVYQDGWQSLFPTPPPLPGRSRELLGQAIWAAQEPIVTFQEGWRQEYSKPRSLAPQPRLQGFVAYAAEVPFAEFQNGWQALFQGPPAQLQPRRSVDALSGWPWPGYGFFLQPITGLTPSDLWFTRWQDPPKAQARSVSLLGQVIWSARAPIVEFATGWGSAFSQPAAYVQPRRSVALLTSYSYPYRVPEVVYQEGWRSAYSTPPTYGKAQPRQQGAIAFATEGFSFTVFPEGWRSAYLLPHQLFRAKPRFPGAISLVAQPPTPAATTPSELGFYVHWQEPSVYLKRRRPVALDLGWAEWPPQVIVQITPPTARPGVTIRLGYGAAPRAKAGTLVSGFVKTTTRRHGKATTGTVPLSKQVTGVSLTAIEDESTSADLMTETGDDLELES